MVGAKEPERQEELEELVGTAAVSAESFESTLADNDLVPVDVRALGIGAVHRELAAPTDHNSVP